MPPEWSWYLLVWYWNVAGIVWTCAWEVLCNIAGMVWIMFWYGCGKSLVRVWYGSNVTLIRFCFLDCVGMFLLWIFVYDSVFVSFQFRCMLNCWIMFLHTTMSRNWVFRRIDVLRVNVYILVNTFEEYIRFNFVACWIDESCFFIPQCSEIVFSANRCT
jgi:hypothetical protein